jgi:type II secretory pathway pseudopilin PulG
MSVLMNQARSRVPRIAEAAVERARLTVVPRASGRPAARVPFVVLVSLLLVGGVAGLLAFNTSMQQASFTATAMQDQAQVLAAKQQSLSMQLAALRNPQRLALKAKAMGMVPPTAPAFIRLSDGKVLGKAVPASSDNSLRVTPLPTRKPRNLTPPPIVIDTVPAKAAAAAAASAKAAKSAATDGAPGAAAASSTGTKKSHVHHAKQGSQR